MAITQGTWGWLGPLGQLDFGITEKLGIASNPNQAKPIGPESQNSWVGKTVDQVNQELQRNANTPITQQKKPVVNSVSNYGTVPTNSPSVQQGPSESDLQTQMMNEINSMYGQSEAILNEQGSNLGQQANLAREGINLQKSQAEGSYKSAYEEAQKLAEGQQATLDLTRRNSESEAIRNLNALQQQTASRYGAGSSTGGAIGEIIVQEFLRNKSSVQTAYFNSLDKINAFTSQAWQVFQNANQKLEEDTGQKLREVDQALRDGLVQVNMAKMQNETARTQARVDLIKSALDNARAISNYRLENQIALEAWKEQQKVSAQDALNYAKQLASEAEQNTFAGQSQIQDIKNSSFLNNNSSNGMTAYNYKRPQIKNIEDDFSQFTNPWLS